MTVREEVTKLCARCGKPFVALGRSPQFCSDACRKAKLRPWRKTVLAAVLAIGLIGPALAQQTHTVYLSMVMTDGFPRQMSAEATYEKCMSTITQMAAREKGEGRRFWYCQPAVANITLGPR